jgi:quinol monooxygenase YgiN
MGTSHPIVYIDRSEIQSGKVNDVRLAVAELVAFVRAQEPQLISYGFYIDDEALTMYVVAVHPDSSSLERHLTVGGPLFRKVGEFIDLQAIDVYGEPSDAVREQLQQKARMLGTSATVAVHGLATGFARLPSA